MTAAPAAAAAAAALDHSECEEYSPDHLPPWASVQGWGSRADKAAGNITDSRRTHGGILSRSGR